MACSRSRKIESDTIVELGIGGTNPEAVAFSSLFFSRNARPPCRKSNPLIDLLNALPGAGDEGANEYKD